MSSLTGTTAGGGGKKIKLKLGGHLQQQQQQQQGSAPQPAASNATTGTLGGSNAAAGLKLRIKLGSGGAAAAAVAAGSGGGGGAAAAGSAGNAAGHYGGQQQQQQQQQQQGLLDGIHPAALGPGADHSVFAAAQQQQQQQQYYAPEQLYSQEQQQYYAQQQDQLQQQQYYSQEQQYSQQPSYSQQPQQQLKLSVRAKLAAPSSNELRYTASGRVQRAASRGLARLIAEEGGVPQDHSLAAPPPGADTRFLCYADPDSPLAERRSSRFAQRKTMDTSQYVDPEEMDFEGQEWVLPDQGEPKPEKPKREPRPKKPKPERQQGQQQYADDDDDDFDLAMEDNLDDEDFDAAMELEDEALEVRPRRGGGGRSSRAAAAAGFEQQQRPQRSSRRAAAAGVAAAVAAAAGVSAADYYADPAAVAAHSAGLAAAAAVSDPAAAGFGGAAASPQRSGFSGGSGLGGGSAGGGSGKRRRGRSRAAAAAGSSDDEDFGGLVDEESDGEGWGAGGAAAGAGGAYEDDEDDDGFEGGTVIGGGYATTDYSSLTLKGDHFNRPLWVCSDGRIFLETYSPIYKQAYDFLIAIAEPVCRPESIHEYVLTPQSLYAAVSVGLDRDTILGVLDKLSKVRLTSKLRRFIAASTKSYGKVKLVLKHNRFWVETSDMEVLDRLLANPVIHASRALDTPGADSRGLVRRKAVKEHAAARLFKDTMAAAADGAAAVRGDDATATAAAAAAELVERAGTVAVPAAAGAAAPAPAVAAAAPAAQPAAAAAGGGGRFYDPFGDSESESDPEDYTGVVPRSRPRQQQQQQQEQQPPATANGDNAAVDATAAAAVGGGGSLEDDDDDEEDLVGVPRARRRAAAAADGAAPAADGSGTAPEAALDIEQQQQQQQQQEGLDAEDDGGSPLVGGRRRLKRAVAAALGSEAEEEEENVEAMMLDDDDAILDADSAQPQRKGRLAATAAVAAATGAAAGDGVGGTGGGVGGGLRALLRQQQEEARAEKQRQWQAKQQQQQQQQQGEKAAAAAAAAAAAGDAAAAAAGYEEVEEEEDPEREVLAFEIRAAEVERVKKECLPGSPSGLDCPLLEEYDFAHDTSNPPLDIGLKRGVQLRPYQEKSLSKMFGNGRARSGIIVLPCGAGKSLVGVAAASRVKKSCLCLCTSSVSVDQWAHQFTLWTNLQEHDVVKFVAGTGGNEAQAEFNKARLAGPCVAVTTFNMIAHGGKRSAYGKAIMDLISSKEWGLLLLDEVHVVPARMFRQVIGIVKAHCKLGLTATLVREDELIGDLNFLIGPKLYEANWLDLTRAGHIANVQCVEVWCPMTREFYAEYLNRETQNDSIKQLLYVMNPNKFMVCQYLIDWHERIRGDKVIVFSDNVYALEAYAKALGKPFIYGKTSHSERTQVLSIFKNTNRINTVFLSKVGDNSLDIPEANVLIQISSHAGSRRQEAQRLGRILRAKKGKPGSGEEEEFSAFFYTLVSRDTQEMYYSAKRQQFLVDQGYAFKVLPALHTTASAEPWVRCRTQREQLELLSQVLHSKELAESLARECGKDAAEAGDKDDLVAHQRGWSGGAAAGGGRGRGRKLGARSMGKATGGADYVYSEWSKGAGAGAGRMQVSGPGGAVERQEKAARAKKLRQKLAG